MYVKWGMLSITSSHYLGYLLKFRASWSDWRETEQVDTDFTQLVKKKVFSFAHQEN